MFVVFEAPGRSIELWRAWCQQRQESTVSCKSPLSEILGASPETLQQAWRRTGRARELIKSSDHGREEEKEGWAQKLLGICSYKLLFRLRTGSKEKPIGYEGLPTITSWVAM